MLTEVNWAANRKTLSANLRASLSLPDSFSDWSYEQRQNYNRQYASYIVAHSASFGPQDLINAQRVLNEGANPLQDTSYDSGIFIDEALNQGNAIVQAGGSILKNGLYIVIIGAVLFYGANYLLQNRGKAAIKP